ncbi:MAG: LLM class F420-dependent oxidoreductase [Polyangiales bacterium]
MKIGIVPINVGGPEVVAQMIPLAQYAEAAGIESVWTFEHAMVPVDYNSRYPYDKSGKMPIQPEGWFVDPLIALSHVASVTKTLRLGTGVNILPQTNPLLLAKQAASIDVLSGGRLMLGLGIGWLEEEFVAMGTPFERRGARFNDYIAAMKKVWSGDVVEHQSDFLSWSGFKSYPTPAQTPHPPLLVGGTSKQALKRVAQLGDGWYAPSGSPEQLAGQLAELRTIASEVGRDYDTLEITGTWRVAAQPDALSAYTDLGVSRLIVPLFSTGETNYKAAIDVLAKAAGL